MSYKIRQILAIFCILNTPVLGQNGVKGLRVPKIVKILKESETI